MAYSEEQVDRCLQHVNFPRSQHPSDPLTLLKQLQARQVSKVPFESLSLHYSRHRQLSLDLGDLFGKIVVDGKGGYCMELNAFFGTVLRGLGYTLINAGARVKIGDKFEGWNHMVNLVTIDGQRYLVDVGFGGPGPMQPARLESGHDFITVAPAEGKFEHRSLAQHTDPNQRVWVYSNREDPTADWREQYCFTEMEFFPEDFAVMNLSTMTLPTSYFVQTVLAMRTIMDEETNELVGMMTLHKNEVKRKYKGEQSLVERLENEDQRVKALEEHFGIVLKQRERDAIKGLPSELRE